MKGRSPFGTVGTLGDFPYRNPATRGHRPLNAEDPTLEGRRKPVPPADIKPPGFRNLIIDSIGVGATTILVVSPSPYTRVVTLRARAQAITVSTEAGVVAGGGRVIDPGEETQPFDLPANTGLYGIAAAAGGFLSRTIRG